MSLKNLNTNNLSSSLCLWCHDRITSNSFRRHLILITFKFIMRKKIQTLAGMAVCALGILATSSCSKDEFFGLEDSVYLDNSLKTEIALSQEFADYAIACYNIVNEMNQPMDTANMQIQGIVDGQPVYYTTGSQEYIIELKEKLKNAYPELAKADRLDFDEIMEIAISNNKVLKGILPNKITRSYPDYNKISNMWIYNASEGDSVDELFFFDSGSCGEWWFKAFSNSFSALNHVIWFVGEEWCYPNGGGLIFADDSAVGMLGDGECWPTIASRVGPRAEADFIILPDANLSQFEIWDFAWHLGPEYYNSNRVHYLYNDEMQFVSIIFPREIGHQE